MTYQYHHPGRLRLQKSESFLPNQIYLLMIAIVKEWYPAIRNVYKEATIVTLRVGMLPNHGRDLSPLGAFFH